MSKRRIAGPGRKVSTGHLRVDTARAVQKLREYQLAEPESWVLEVLRAAITLGATRLEVAGDASDVSVAWDGGLLDDETMRTVLDELVNPGALRNDGAIRRLATGLNTALGRMPRRVDIERTDASGQRTRVRYTSDLLDAPAMGEAVKESGAGLESLMPERIAPADAGAVPGMRVTLRRRAGFDTFRRFLGRAEPDELRLVRERADDVPVPLHIGGDVLDREGSPHDLVRIPLAAGLEGFLALVDADSTAAGNQPAWVDFAERGVILTREPLPLPSVWQDPRVSVPIRLFLDRQSLPTNASRSSVRMDDALRTALDVAIERVPRLLEETHRLLLGETSEVALQPSLEQGDAATRRHRLRKSVLHLIAAYVRGKPWRFDPASMPTALQPLMALPLLRDAVGAPASVLDFWDTTGLVYRGPSPLSEALYGETLRKLPFIPLGDAATVLLPDGPYDSDAVDRLLALAAEKGRKKAAFLEGATMAASIPSSDRDAWVVVPIRGTRPASFVEHESLPERDIEGEVALYASEGTARGRITLLHESRPIEDVLVAGPCSFHAVVACPRLTPKMDYQGVEDDNPRRDVLDAVERAVVLAAELAALLALGEPLDLAGARVLGGAPPPGELPSAHALALEAAHTAAVERAGDRPYADASPLTRVRCISVLHPSGERRDESIREVLARARDTKALLYRAGRGRQPAGAYPLAMLDKASVTTLATLAGVRAARVDPSSRSAPWVPHLAADAVLRVRGDGFVGEIGWGNVEAGWTLFRDGVALEQSTVTPHILPAAVHIDDARVVVDAETGKVVLRPNHHELLFMWEQALLGALIAAARGKAPAELYVQKPSDVARQLSRAMALAPRPFRKHFDADYRHLSDALPLPTARGRTMTLGTLRARKTAWSLPPGARIDFDHPEFEPVVVDPAWAKWVEASLGRDLRDGTEVQHEFARQAGGAARRERVMAQTSLPAPVADPQDPFERGVQKRELTGVLRAPSQPPFALTLTVKGRILCKERCPLDLPLSGQLDVPPAFVDAGWDSLNDAGKSALALLVRDELEGLLVTLAKGPARELLSPRGEALLNAWAGLRGGRKGEARVREALSHARAWPSVQGPLVSLLDAKRRGRIHAAVFEGPWLGPRDGERKVQQDHPIISVADAVKDGALARFAELVDVGPLTDTTHAVQQLQARRGVEQGTSEMPRLGSPDAISLARLLKDDERLLFGLGPGEARLALGAEGTNPTTVLLFVEGERVGSQALPVFPPVELAIEASGYLPARKAATVDKRKLHTLTQRVQRLSAKLVLRAFEQPHPSEPLRRATRTAWLGQKSLDDDVAAGLPVLETTAGGWTTLHALRALMDSERPPWLTTDPMCTVVPEDEHRIVVRLSKSEARAVREKLAFEDATERLAAQAIRVENMKRPKVRSLDARDVLAALSEQAVSTALTYAELHPSGDESTHGSLVVLSPEHASLAGLHVHRERHPLGVFPVPSDWPVLAVVDDPTLTPNVRYDAPEYDERSAKMLEQLNARTQRALHDRFDPGDDFCTRRVDAKLPSGTVGVGLIGLADPLLPGELAVVPPQQALAREYPLRGDVWTCLPSQRTARHEVSLPEAKAIVKAAYAQLLMDLANGLHHPAPTEDPSVPVWARDASRWSPAEQDFAHAHLVVGASKGCLDDTHPIVDAWLLSCFRPVPISLRATLELLNGKKPVFVVEPEGPEAHGADPLLVADGSLLSHTLATLFGGRLRRPRGVEQPAQRAEAESPETTERESPAASHATSAAPAPHALAKLAEELTELLALARGPSARSPIRVGISPRRREPLMTVDEAAQRIFLAGQNPMLLAAARALAAEDPTAGLRAATALGAHALVLLDDAGPRESRPDQLALMEAWLTPV